MKLTEQQMCEVAEKFFEYGYYAIEDDVILIDGGVSIDTILAAADYIRGIQQAEKKLALTWQDMKAIDQICHDVAFDDIDRQDPIFYNEDLKRFNEQRNERLCKSCRRYA